MVAPEAVLRVDVEAAEIEATEALSEVDLVAALMIAADSQEVESRPKVATEDSTASELWISTSPIRKVLPMRILTTSRTPPSKA